MRGTSRLVAVVLLCLVALTSMLSIAGASSKPGVAGGRGSEKFGGVVEITTYANNDGPSSARF